MTSRRASQLLATIVALYLLVTVSGDGNAQMLCIDGAAIGSAAMLWIGATRQPARVRLPWQLLAAGISVWVLGDIIWDVYILRTGETPTASLADIAYLIGYPLLGLGFVVMIGRRAPAGWRNALLDVIGIAAAAALAAWEFLIPSNDKLNTVEMTLAIAYPMGDVLLLAALAWLVLSPGIRGVPSMLATASVAMTLAADVALAVGPIADGPRLWIDNAYVVSYLLLAIASLHERSAELSLPDPLPADRLNPARVVFLGAAQLSAPVITSIASHTSAGALLPGLVASVLISSVVLARFVIALREAEHSREALTIAASTDPLTQLDNRRQFLARSEACVDARHPQPIGALMIDIDHFKTINDTHGHAVGDEVLRIVSDRCRAVVRPGDVLGRLGGDEFAMVLRGCGVAEAADVARRIAENLRRSPIATQAGHLQLTVSIGVAAGPFHSIDMALAEADAALYEAKRAGRDRSAVRVSSLIAR